MALQFYGKKDSSREVTGPFIIIIIVAIANSARSTWVSMRRWLVRFSAFYSAASLLSKLIICSTLGFD